MCVNLYISDIFLISIFDSFLFVYLELTVAERERHRYSHTELQACRGELSSINEIKRSQRICSFELSGRMGERTKKLQ